MNPMALMKIMNAKNKFNASHPKFGAFLNAAFAGGIQDVYKRQTFLCAFLRMDG